MAATRGTAGTLMHKDLPMMHVARRRIRARSWLSLASSYATALMLSVSCAHGPSSSDAANKAPTAPKTAASASTANDEADPLKARVLKLLKDTSGYRQLHNEKPLSFRPVNRTQLTQHMKQILKRQHVPGRTELSERALGFLGWVPEGVDFAKTVLEAHGDQIAGLYDPERDEFFLRDDMTAQVPSQIISHELVHVLQDQAFGLDWSDERHEHCTDQVSAKYLLMEGDAQLASYGGVFVGHEDARASQAQRERLLELNFGTAVPVPKEQLLIARRIRLTYGLGTYAVHKIHAQGGWTRVNEFQRKPPRYSAQVLYPDDWGLLEDQSVQPRVVAWDLPVLDSLCPQGASSYQTEVGAIDWVALLSSTQSLRQSFDRLRNWRGDGYLYTECKDSALRMGFVLLEADSPSAAQMLGQQLRRMFSGRAQQKVLVTQRGRSVRLAFWSKRPNAKAPKKSVLRRFLSRARLVPQPKGWCEAGKTDLLGLDSAS